MIAKCAFVSCLAALSCFMSCNNQKQEQTTSSTPPAAAIQKIRLNNPYCISSFHPHTGVDLHCRLFQKALFEGLTRINHLGEPELAAAEKVLISPSQTVYTFTLRSLNWTNGEPVTAFQFEKAWKAAIAPQSPCLRSDLFYPIKNAKAAKQGLVGMSEVGIHAPDASTLIVELEHPSPYFLDLVANPLFSPLYDDNSTPGVFNGPFYLAQLDHDTKMVLQKNHGYWDSAHVTLETIDVSFISDAHTALLMYEKGELDWVGHPFTQLPQDALPRLEKSPDYRSQPLDAVYWLCVNTEEPPLNSVKIRRALSMVLDREALAHHVLLGETPTKGLIPTGLALLGEHEFYEDNNLKLSKALFEEGMEELNLTRETFPTILFSHSDLPGQKKLAESIQHCWKEAFDIDVKLQSAEWNTFFARLGDRQFQIGGCIWFSVFHDPIYNLEFFKEKTHRYNSPQWENKHYQQLLKLADTETNPDIRREHLRQAEQLILQEMPVIPLFNYHAKYLKSPCIKKMKVSSLGQIDFKWAYIDNNNDVSR